MAKDLYKQDLYLILGVDETASEKEIIKSYRKRALKCHPDKNPDNPKAAEQFHQLSEILKLLTDAAARTAYDRSRTAKKVTAARNRALDSKRKKFKEDLEAREQAAEERSLARQRTDSEKNLQKEIDRLKKEGSRLLEEEQERLRQELKRSKTEPKQPETETEETIIARIKLKWKSSKDDTKNAGYDESTLTNILNRYGNINSLLISSKRNGSAIVEFESSGVSSKILEEKGLADSPFTMTWLSGKPSEYKVINVDRDRTNCDGAVPSFSVPPPLSSESSPGFLFSTGNVEGGGLNSGGFFTSGNKASGNDFESLVLMKMRQAEERKKLIAQMQKEDEEL